MTNALNSRLVALALTATSLLASAAPAAALTLADGMQVTVRYADLDVGHAAGQKILVQRVERAASKVCGPEPYIRAFSQRAAYEKCRTIAIEGARPQMERARLEATAQFASR